MTQASETTQNAIPDQVPFTAEDWAQTPKAVQDFVLTLLARVQALEAELAALRERVNRNSRNSSQPPSSDGPGVPPKPSQQGKSGRKRGGQKGHPGTTRKLFPPEEVKEIHEVKPLVCCSCRHELEGEDAEPHRHQVTDIPPVKVEVTEYRLHTLECPECGETTRAELPEGVPQGAFGPRLQATISLLSGHYHLSKRKSAEILKDFFQAEIGLGSVPALEQRTSEAIKEPVQEVREYIQKQPAVNIDETGWREMNQRAWLWTVATPKVTAFFIRLRRSGEVAREILSETFQGIAGSDRWSAYNWLPIRSRQLCWSHLLRDFQAFVERGGESQQIGEDILEQAWLMFGGWHRVQGGVLSREAFQQQMQAVEQKVGELLRQGTTCDHKKTAGTCRDILKREDALWTFVYVEDVEPTNNLAEQQVRSGVLWRKNSFGTQSKTGSRFAERIMTAVATLKQQRRNVLEYLTQACEAANWGLQAPSLLPVDAIEPGGETHSLPT